MKFLNLKSGIAALGLLVASINSMAQSATVTFNGSVNSATCYITLSTSSGSTTSASTLTLGLPTVSTAALTSGATTGKTSFYMGVSGCSAGTALTPKLYLSSSLVNTSGYMTTGLTNLVFELLDSSSVTVVLSTTPTSKVSFTVPTTTTTTTAYSNQFYIQYRADGGAVTTTGSPTASMTVNLYYT